MPPETIARYRIIRLLGGGGQANVYLAEDPTLDRQVALKLLASEALSDEQAFHRLRREARGAAALDHPNICPIYEVGQDDGQAFIAMQYVEGETLSDQLLRGRLTPGRAIELAIQVADALAVAHRQGVIHRDIKPSNIMITARGQVKVLDFGIATRGATEDPNEGPTVSTLDQTGMIAGTAPYMSPEQVQNQPLDGRSDLFALGAVLYECLTGQRAFAGRSTLEICGAVLHVEPTPPSRVHQALTPAHDRLCRTLLAKNPADRVQNADEARRLLELALDTEMVPRLDPEPETASVPPAPRPSRSPRRVLTGVAAAVDRYLRRPDIAVLLT